MPAKLPYEELEKRLEELELEVSKGKKIEETLRKYKVIISSITEPVSFVNRDYVYEIVNEARAQYEGMTPAEFSGRKAADFFAAELFASTLKPNLDRCFAGETVQFKQWFQLADGSQVYMDVAYYPVWDETGKAVIGACSYSRDRTEQKRAEDALVESEGRYRSLFQNRKVVMLMLDPETGDIHDANPAAVEFYGWSYGELTSMNIREINLLSSEEVSAFMGEVLRKQHGHFHFQHRLHDGTSVDIEVDSVPAEFGGKTYLYSIVHDVSRRMRAEEALKQGEEVMRYIIKHDPNATAVFDRDLRYIAVSDRYLDVYNLPPSDLTGKHLYDVFPEFPQNMKDMYRKALQGNTLRSEDQLVKRQDGSIVYSRWECRPWYTAQGSIGGMILYIEITTERKLAENELRLSEERYRRLAENSPDMIYRMSLPDGRYEYVSPASATITGYSPEIWYENPFFIKDIAHPDSRAYLEEQCQKLLNGEMASTFEYKITSRQGENRWLYQRNVAVRGEDGKLLAIEGIVTNISDLKQVEEELIRQKKLFETMFNTIPDGVLITNTKRDIILANRGAEQMFGYARDELLGRNTVMLYGSEEDYRLAGERIFDDVAGKLGDLFTITYRDKSGREFPGETFGAKLFDKNNIWIGNLAVMRDITHRKQIEMERIQLQSQLLQAQKVEAIGTLAGGIAHDFNNILTSIIGFTELALAEAEKGTNIESDLREVYGAGKRAKELVKQILTFARQSDEELMPIQIDIIIKEVLKFIRSTIPTTITINERIVGDSLILGSPTQIYQVMMNLCTNAAQAMEEEGGILNVSLKEFYYDGRSESQILGMAPGDYFELQVSDTGVGIATEYLDSIFDPYFTTKVQGEGTGLGLATVQGIVENYGGKVTVASKPGKGATFTVYLPITRKRRIDSPIVSSELPRGNERILFVDDEAPITNMASQIISRLGYTVSARTSSIEALELFRAKANDFDMVITDMTMPNMTGDKLAMELLTIRPDIPIILCTGYSKKISEEKAKQLGLKGFINKPFVKSDLANTIRKVLDKENTSW